MIEKKNWIPSGPVTFAILLCIMMLAGDIFSGDSKNPFSLVFYSFLPTVLWMISEKQHRAIQAIKELSTRVEQLENSHPTATK